MLSSKDVIIIILCVSETHVTVPTIVLIVCLTSLLEKKQNSAKKGSDCFNKWITIVIQEQHAIVGTSLRFPLFMPEMLH